MLKRLWCVLKGHTPPYSFHGVPHCSRCWTCLEPYVSKHADRPRTEKEVEILLQNGWTIAQIRRRFPSLRRYLPS